MSKKHAAKLDTKPTRAEQQQQQQRSARDNDNNNNNGLEYRSQNGL